MNEYHLTPEEDAANEKNIVERVREKEFEVINNKEAITRANLLHQYEHEQLAREQQRLGIKAEGKRIDVENLSEKAVEQDNANNIAKRTGNTIDRKSQLFTELEKNHQIELMEQVHRQFRVAGTKFHFKDQPDKLAFKDKGERIVSASNDDRVAKAMAMMAKAKGWKTIKVSGHPEFQREVWMEANVRGITVRGFKPTEQDVKLLENKRERTMYNTVKHEQMVHEVKKSDKAKVAEAVSSALIDSQVKNHTQREVLKAAVGARMVEREKINKVPTVPIYDKTAATKSQQQERTGPVVERNSERIR